MEETKKEHKERTAKLSELLAKTSGIGTERSVFTDASARELIKLAWRHQRLAEHACNRELAERERDEEQHVEKRIRELVALFGPGLTVHFDGDPRGFTVKLHFPPVDGRKPYNTWGGEETGWGI
jgi:hypothetical protein